MSLMTVIQTMPHERQRYPTVGDWVFNQGVLDITVSDLHNPHFETLVALHEFVEAKLCEARGISEEQVSTWDKEHLDHPDPGSIPGCPYYREHLFALMLERTMAGELEVNWQEYEEALEKL